MSLTGLFHSKSQPADSSSPVPGFGGRAEELLHHGQYCLLLDPDEQSWSDRAVATAWEALEEGMALVPSGEIVVSGKKAGPGDIYDELFASAADSGESEPAEVIEIDAFYVDRFAVTNEDFMKFIAAGGYSDADLWPADIWSNVLQFVDRTGRPGPRHWSHGRPPRKREHHPVVGISWYEADAYARWVGKQLPSAHQWEWAGTWTAGPGHQAHRNRYPWGDSFDPRRANTWTDGPGRTVPVDEYYAGCTPNGVYQLIGNVWEWTATPYRHAAGPDQEQVGLDQEMFEIRGGAFDTYFENQATCRFRTGQPRLFRGANVGFRCCIAAGRLRERPDPPAFLDS